MDFAELQTYTRQRCGIEQNQTITDQELQTLLNMSMGALYTIIATDYEDYNVLQYLAVIGGSNQIPLPPDFFKLRAVDYGSPGAWITVHGFGLQERNRNSNPIANMFYPYGNQVARRVRLMNNSIFVEPENASSGQYQVWYTPKFSPLVLGTDTLPLAMDLNGFQEYAVAATGAKIYNKLTLSTQGFLSEMAYFEDMVRNGAKNRMSSGPKRMQNVRNDSGFGSYGGGGWGC